ncbi:MAG TPA: FecR domain-containing protein [Kofleriaceae bacterium]|nr:FecR domain-containing protein [Kofleriaceae bacterium]
MSDYLYDKTGDDAEVAELEGLLGGYAHRAPLRLPPPRRRRRWLAIAIPAAAVAIAAAIALLVIGRDEAGRGCPGGGPGFAFAIKGAAARCGGAAAAAGTSGTLPVGAWLETAAGAVADVRVADIGDLVVYGDSRLRLVGTGPDQHRLELARGRLSARVLAPPRLFVIDTPVAAAVDLGCAYDLTVDADGHTHLRVTSGAVSLEGKDGVVAYAPMGTEVVAVPGRGPGTPVAIDAAPAVRAAAARFDAGDAAAAMAVAVAAGPRDTVTLWNLLARTRGADREAVFRALDALSIRPEWVLEEDVLAGRPQALEDWRQSLDGEWMMR